MASLNSVFGKLSSKGKKPVAVAEAPVAAAPGALDIDPINKGFVITTTYSPCDIKVKAAAVTEAAATTPAEVPVVAAATPAAATTPAAAAPGPAPAVAVAAAVAATAPAPAAAPAPAPAAAPGPAEEQLLSKIIPGTINTQIKITYTNDKIPVDIIDITFPYNTDVKINTIQTIVTLNLANFVMNMYNILLDIPSQNINDFLNRIKNAFFNTYYETKNRYPIKFINDINELKTVTFNCSNLLGELKKSVEEVDTSKVDASNIKIKTVALKLLSYFRTFFSGSEKGFHTYIQNLLKKDHFEIKTTEDISLEQSQQVIQYSIIFLHEYIIFIHVMIDSFIQNLDDAKKQLGHCITNEKGEINFAVIRVNDDSLFDPDRLTLTNITHTELHSSQVNMVRIINAIDKLLAPTKTVGGSNMKFLTPKKLRKTENRRFKNKWSKRKNTAKRFR